MKKTKAKERLIKTIITCPHCENEFVIEPEGWVQYEDMLLEQERPHENPFDCIKYLRASISVLADDILSIRRGLKEI
jgi:hypothetical protein